MSTKKHESHPHLTGEYRWGDAVQLVMLLVFLLLWIGDSFFLHWSTFLAEKVGVYVRIPLAAAVLLCGWYLARTGMKQVFGTRREKAEVISDGVFARMRHPIYTGALCFYLGAIIWTMSLLSLAFWVLILAVYLFIARYEERILVEAFGDAYIDYKKRTGMIFPRLFS